MLELKGRYCKDCKIYTDKRLCRNELHPKSFLSNFWGAVHYDTAAQHQWLIRGIPHQAQGIDFCICFFQLTQDFPSEP